MPTPPPTPEPDATTLPDHLATVLAAHRAFDRDTRRFLRALGRLDPHDEATSTALVAWFDAASQALRHHHAVEDQILRPALRQRRRAFAVTDERMRDEHAALDAAIGDATGAVRSLRAAEGEARTAARRAAEDAVVHLRALLLEHVQYEEAVVVPLLGAAFTAEENRRLDRATTGRFARRELGFSACWSLDAATPRQRAVLWAGLPWRFRLRYRLWLRDAYRRTAAVLPTA